MQISVQSTAGTKKPRQGSRWCRVPWARGLLGLILGGGSASGTHAATWYLQGNQNSWELLENWYSQPLGGGTHPATLNANDEFDVNCFQIRTKSKDAETFGGKTLILTGGEAGLLNLRTVAPAVCVIPNLMSRGGKIQNYIAGKEPAVSVVEITRFTNTANTTLSAGSKDRGLDVTIGTLSGDGDLTALGVGGGSVSLKINSAENFKGTLYIADSCVFSFKNGVVSAGALYVDSTAKVALDNDVSFSGLTVGNEIKAPGVYPADSLGFTGKGRITVKNAATSPKKQASAATNAAARWHSFGVNFPGGGFGTAKYHTDPKEWDFYHARGLNLIRVAFKWERVQPKLFGELDPEALAGLDTNVALAAARGMKVVLDMHNYARYALDGDGGDGSLGKDKKSFLIGTPEVPYEAYKDVWKKLATHFATKEGVYGYDIMNEPHATNGLWPKAAQAGVDGVREGDRKRHVIIEGDGWASATAWMRVNGDLDVKDPSDLVIYSAHVYFDFNYSGKYDRSYNTDGVYPNIGEDRTAPFVHWLKLRKAKGLIGEYGIPAHVVNPDIRWFPVLENFLAYLDRNEVSGTYWAAGDCWSPGYKLQVGRLSDMEVQDTPTLAVLKKYRDPQ